MQSLSTSSRRIALVVASVLVAAAWFTWLRPVTLGGDVSYVVVQGRSMEPTYEDGDLVLVREESQYSNGDVIAFRAGGTFGDPTRIIHRIVGDAGDGAFKTQGDNRDRLDPWEPGPDDVIGRAVLHVPMAGDVAGVLTNPAMFAAIGGAAVVVGGTRSRRRRRAPRVEEHPIVKHLKREDPSPNPLPRPSGSGASSRLARATRPRWAFAGLVVSVLVALPVLAVGWSALRAPDSTQRLDQVGELSYGIALDYRFTGAKSAVYPTGVVTTSRNPAGAVVANDPLYSRLLDRLEIELAFRAGEEGAASIASSYAVDVVVETPGGWSTTLQSIEATRFDQSAVETLALDLRAVALQVAAVAELTGVGGDAYTINVTPSVELVARADLGDLREQVAAPLTFAVEGNVITATAIDVSEHTPLTRMVNERATYAIGPLELGTQAARGLLGGLALVVVAGIAWFASVLFGGLGLGEADRIAVRYRSQMIDVAGVDAPPGPVVMVSAIDELARIAKVEQTVILHEDVGDGAHRYRVFLGSVTYEYETAPEHAGAAIDVPLPAGDEGDG